MQKGGFCNVKVWFLHAKNHTFAAQKGVFLQSIVIQIVTQHYFSHILFPLLASQFVIFCRLQPIVFVDDAGAMNLPLRLSECTLRIYCVMNNPCRMYAAVYFTQRISHFVVEQNNLFASVLMLNHCLLLLFLSPMEQLFKVGKVFFHNHTYALCVERVTCKVSIVGSVVEV